MGDNPALTVAGTPGSNAPGLSHLAFKCPRCGAPQGVSGPSRIHCPFCTALLDVTAPEGFQAGIDPHILLRG